MNKTFLFHFLDDYLSARTENVDERVEALERAAQTLEMDALFDVGGLPLPSRTLQHIHHHDDPVIEV